MTDGTQIKPYSGRGDDGRRGHPSIDIDSLDRGALIKIIDYTLLKPEETVEGYSRFLETAAGMDFVKTATGLGPGGAIVHDVRLMRDAVAMAWG